MISIEITDENGEVLESFDGYLGIGALVDAAPKDSRCLSFIDPYGDTVFNALQLPVLKAELLAVVAGIAPTPERAVLARLADFVDVAMSRQPHAYLKFVGD